MKIVAFILSVYILVLTAIPCSDEPGDNTLHKIGLSKNGTDSHQNDTGHCSPFCDCYCCVSPVISQAYTLQFTFFSFIQRHYTGYLGNYIPSVFTSIWQPPEII